MRNRVFQKKPGFFPRIFEKIHIDDLAQDVIVGSVQLTPHLRLQIPALDRKLRPLPRAIAFIMSGRLWDTEKPFLLPLDCQIQWLGPGSGDPGRANGINAIALALSPSPKLGEGAGG